jgi:hypothetical protein
MEGIPSFWIEKIHTPFFINLFNKGQTKEYASKTSRHHTTPTNPTMGEDHVTGPCA